MATSGRPVEITFTPAVAGKVKILASTNAQGIVGSDWGATRALKAFCEQSGATTYSMANALSNARAAYFVIGSFDVAAGALVKCGLWGGVSGAASMTVYAGANVLAEFTPT